VHTTAGRTSIARRSSDPSAVADHHAAIVKYPDNNTIFDRVSGNKADAMITDASEIRWQIRQNPQLCGAGLDHPFTFEQKAYLTPEGSPALQQWTNQWLNIAQNDGIRAYRPEMAGRYGSAVDFVTKFEQFTAARR
jgi:ABC-type amino acid transport substrate-binding protein